MRIFIDADGCPVVDLTVKIAVENDIECTIICDTSHEFNKIGAKTLVVEKGSDSADFKIVNCVSCGDIVVTQDYGLAAMCLSRKAVPISQDGMIYNENNIDRLLFTRYISKKIRNSGGRLKGPSKRTSDKDEAFESALIQIIKQAKRTD